MKAAVVLALLVASVSAFPAASDNACQPLNGSCTRKYDCCGDNICVGVKPRQPGSGTCQVAPPKGCAVTGAACRSDLDCCDGLACAWGSFTCQK